MSTYPKLATVEDLRNFILICPIIDHHAHNLSASYGLGEGEVLRLSSEAPDSSQTDATETLAHIRVMKMLREMLNLPETADIHAILDRRSDRYVQDKDGFVKDCLEGFETLLIDDGYEDPKEIEPYGWHSKFTPSPCKRIVRIERVATDLLRAMYKAGELPRSGLLPNDDDDEEEDELLNDYNCKPFWEKFMEKFQQAIRAALRDDEVVGFKSILSYATGLNWEARDWKSPDVVKDFRVEYLLYCKQDDFEICVKSVNDALVGETCALIKAYRQFGGRSKPFQFHTGFGGPDQPLSKSNPTGLQPLLVAYPEVNFVLLHAAYPYTREAGYMVGIHGNCYLDLGLISPKLSRPGQERTIREALEMGPMHKLMWSTDGCYQPESFWLAQRQGREAMINVFYGMVTAGDLTLQEARQAVGDIFFENANRLYSLGLRL